MKHFISRSLNIAIGFLILLAVYSHASSPQFSSITSNSNTISKYSKFELTPKLTATYTNPYDYDQIEVQCIFSSPSGRVITVDGFFMQDYLINSAGYLQELGNGDFKIRFTPDEAGTWSYQLTCHTPDGTAQTSLQTFQCTESTGKGFICKEVGNNYLHYDDGTQYIPIGMDLCWGGPNSIVTDYTPYLANMAANHANFIRIWMAAWSFGLEWSPTSSTWWFGGLKRYEQHNAFYLDWLLEECRQRNMTVMICDNHHDQVMATKSWADNPYNQTLGGMCQKGSEFFTNTSAISTYKNRLRYMVARYGFSPQIEAWELFNEVDQLWNDSLEVSENQYIPAQLRQDITNWHTEMVAFLKAKDPNRHLVTTSTGMPAIDLDLFKTTNVDLAQMHTYLPEANPEQKVTLFCQDYLTSYGIPILNSEYGLSIWEQEPSMDPTGIHFHNGMWATLFGGALGPAQEWNWNYIAGSNLYSHFSAIATVAENIDFPGGNYRPAEATTSASARCDITVIPAYNQWGAAPEDSFDVNELGEVFPDVSNMCQFLFGSAQYQAPFIFNVQYPDDGGTFTVQTGPYVSTGGAKLHIRVDGVVRGGSYDSNALSNYSYAVTGITKNLPGETHTIMVTNDGADWIHISRFIFGGAGNPLSAYVLKSADNCKAAGWLHNKPYDWLKTGNPPTITDGVVSIQGMTNGTYAVRYYDCSTGEITTTTSAIASQGKLVLTPPEIAWDKAFTAIATSTTANYGSTTICPGNNVWGGAGTEHSFTISDSGTVFPDEDTLNSVLYGTAQYQATLQFTVNYLAAGEFQIVTGQDRSTLPNIVVSIDGQETFRQNDAASATTYSVPVPAGSHVITLSNDGSDWIRIAKLIFTNTKPMMTYGDSTIYPGNNVWGGTGTEHTFAINSNGVLYPGEETLNSILYGMAQYHATLQFAVDFLAPGEFQVFTGADRSAIPNIAVTVDGHEVFRQNDAAVLTRYSVPISAGSHVIMLNNDGCDWIRINKLVFTKTNEHLITTITPAKDGWSLSDQNAFIVDSEGNLDQPLTELNPYIFGLNMGRRPISFQISYAKDGEFRLKTGYQNGVGNLLTVTVNGVEKVRQEITSEQTISIPITAGNRTIVIDNEGPEYIWIPQYTIVR